MKASEFEKAFDANEDVAKYVDKDEARRPMQDTKRVNVDFPVWMVHQLDREARKLGVTRQSVIKVWLSERLEARE